jgi:hypothetical protein
MRSVGSAVRLSGVGFGGGVPVIFFVVGIVLAVKLHAWIPAAITIAFAVFGTWLLTRYGRSGRWGR